MLFEQAISAAPSTLAAHASMLTSLIVPHHGASYLRRTPLPPARVTLAEVLEGHGYATRSWNGGAQLDPVFGLGQGFEDYRSIQQAESVADLPTGPSDADRLLSPVQEALGWLDARADSRPFFLFLHSYEVHHPYRPDPERRALFARSPTRLGDHVTIDDLRRFNDGEWRAEPGDVRHIVASYDAEIRSADEAFGILLDGLRDRGLDGKTLVVLTSDHGEEFGEHGRLGWHSHTLYDELLHVPLILRLPGGARGGTRVEGQVRAIDLAPTILDVAGIRPPAVFQGRSLAPEIAAAAVRRPALSTLDGGRGVALRDGGWKWIRHRGLYDLRSDPAELRPRKGASGVRERRASLRRRAESWLAAGPARPDDDAAVDVDDELEHRLRALGYVDEP